MRVMHMARRSTVAPGGGGGSKTPAWLAGVALNQWVEIASSSMSAIPAGMVAVSTTPAGRMNAWNGFAYNGAIVWCVRQGGHGDYWGNEVLRFDASADAPVWEVVKASSTDSAGVQDNADFYTDGTPAAVHGYYTQRFIAARNWVLSIGSTARAKQGGTSKLCLVYDIAANAYLSASTVPDVPVDTLLNSFAVWDDPVTGDVWHAAAGTVNRWNQATNTWTANVVVPAGIYGFPSVGCTDTTRRRALYMSDAPGATQSYVIEMAAPSASAITVAGAGATFPTGSHDYGLTYCPITDRFYAMPGAAADGADLYEIHPTTWVVSLKSTAGATGMPRGSDPSSPTVPVGGVCSRFTYVPSLGGILYFPQHAANAWFLRLH